MICEKPREPTVLTDGKICTRNPTRPHVLLQLKLRLFMYLEIVVAEDFFRRHSSL